MSLLPCQVVDLEGQLEVKTRELFDLEAHTRSQERAYEQKLDELEESLKESQNQIEALTASNAQSTNLLEDSRAAVVDKVRRECVSGAWMVIRKLSAIPLFHCRICHSIQNQDCGACLSSDLSSG